MGQQVAEREGRILVVDDEPGITEMLRLIFTQMGFEVLCAPDGESGLATAFSSSPDLILLDVRLPKLDGFTVCQRICERQRTPIILLTACNDEAEKIYGLEIGADDYVTKPFSVSELVARVHSQLRRNKARRDEGLISLSESLLIDTQRFEVRKDGEQVTLTPREFQVLLYLARHRGQLISRERLLEAVWGYDYFGGVRVVDVTIRRLRAKIEEDPSHPHLIRTRRGVGYAIEA